jgi:pyrroloquinoline quinone (PQQ) biosynthesis protein C
LEFLGTERELAKHELTVFFKKKEKKKEALLGYAEDWFPHQPSSVTET